SRTASIVAALVTCLTFLPLATPTLIYAILNLAPQMGSFAAAALLAAAAFVRYGRRNWRSDLPFVLLAIGLLAWSALASITIMLLSAPFLLLCAVSGIIAANKSTERQCKIGLLAVAGMLLAGPAIYLLGTVLDTAAIAFPKELE